MDNASETGGGNKGLYFIVGILVAVVAVIAFVMMDGAPQQSSDPGLSISITEEGANVEAQGGEQAGGAAEEPAAEPAPEPAPAPAQ